MSAGVVLCLVHSHLCFVLVGRYVEYMVTMLSWKLKKGSQGIFTLVVWANQTFSTGNI